MWTVTRGPGFRAEIKILVRASNVPASDAGLAAVLALAPSAPVSYLGAAQTFRP